MVISKEEMYRVGKKSTKPNKPRDLDNSNWCVVRPLVEMCNCIDKNNV